MPTTKPTTFELAMIAATLGRTAGSASARELVSGAMGIWRAAERALSGDDEIAAQMAARQAELVDLEQRILARTGTPRAFPVPFEEFLRRVVPGRTEADRMATYRRFVRWSLRLNDYYLKHEDGDGLLLTDIPDPTPSRVAKAVERHKANSYAQGDFIEKAHMFFAWFDLEAAERKRVKACGAADARWRKKNA